MILLNQIPAKPKWPDATSIRFADMRADKGRATRRISRSTATPARLPLITEVVKFFDNGVQSAGTSPIGSVQSQFNVPIFSEPAKMERFPAVPCSEVPEIVRHSVSPLLMEMPSIPLLSKPAVLRCTSPTVRVSPWDSNKISKAFAYSVSKWSIERIDLA